ncbi:hypothetical protein BCR42DRAFT_230175 [Absidia repens]|uniref:Uncharacterized protein n=1 Tax=Absidia repens TaxID=90262 RepID=A0A1X2IMY8_9FUNG|nr:hypothetical protein BCR42DRAFT_230175 [Absidia repens]
MYMESLSQNPPTQSSSADITTKASSLSQLASRSKPSSPLASLRSTTGSKNTLSSLAATSTTNALSTSAKLDKTSSIKNGASSLLSLAQKSAGQRNMSALQNLANRQKSSSPTSLSSLSKQTSTGNSTTGDRSHSNTLTHLASQSRTNKLPSSQTSLSSLASSSRNASKLLGSSAKQLNESSNTETPSPAATTDNKQIEQRIKTATISKPDIDSKTATAVTSSNENHFDEMISKATKSTVNPLIAPPSPAAVFLFQPHEQRPSSLSADINMALPNSLAQAFYETMSLSSVSKTKLFKFDAPSPDDIVMTAQSQRGSNKPKKTDPVS